MNAIIPIGGAAISVMHGSRHVGGSMSPEFALVWFFLGIISMILFSKFEKTGDISFDAPGYLLALVTGPIWGIIILVEQFKNRQHYK